MKPLVVYNPISNEGHLDSWHAMFVDLLLQAGWPIIAVTNDPQGLEQKLTLKGCDMRLLKVLCIDEKPRRLRERMRSQWQRWNAYCDARKFQQNSRCQFPPLWLINAVQSIFSLAHRIYFGRKQTLSRKDNIPQASSATHLDPQVFCDRVNEIIATQTGGIAAVLNMYVDAYPQDVTSWARFSLQSQIAWMGLCITPGPEPVEGYYSLPDYKGTLFLDEDVCDHYQDRLPERHFEFLPDITETALPDTVSALAAEIKKRANRRKIVFLGGSIGKQKNLSRWLELVALSDPGKWFFVQIGRINKNNLSSEDEQALLMAQAQPPAHLFIWSDYLPDERSFNEIIALSDVIFAVYRDFSRSSNMLSKAAYFEKPILVTENTLMATRVQRYGIGLAVKQDDSSSMQKGLERLEALPDLSSKFAAYREDISPGAVQHRLVSFIQKCIAAEQKQK